MKIIYLSNVGLHQHTSKINWSKKCIKFGFIVNFHLLIFMYRFSITFYSLQMSNSLMDSIVCIIYNFSHYFISKKSVKSIFYVFNFSCLKIWYWPGCSSYNSIQCRTQTYFHAVESVWAPKNEPKFLKTSPIFLTLISLIAVDFSYLIILGWFYNSV